MELSRKTELSDRVFGISLAAAVVFSAVAGLGLTFGADMLGVRIAQTYTSPLLDSIGDIFSLLGDVEVVSVAFCVFCAGLFFTGRRVLAVRLVIAYAVVSFTELFMKLFLPVTPVPDSIGRTEDYTPTVDVLYSYPYPSGHILRTVVFLGALYVLWPNRYVRLAIVAFLALVSLTRVYLGVHWPSDMVGGALLGIVGVAWAFRSKKAWTK